MQSRLPNSYITSEQLRHHQAPLHAPGVLAGLYVKKIGMLSALMPGTSGKLLCLSHAHTAAAASEV
jgi:hypothetical protein